MTQPKPITKDLEREFAKMNAGRRTYPTRLCWCRDTDCRWREPDVPCPSIGSGRDAVQLYTTIGG